MLKLEFAEWIRQVFFPVQAYQAAGDVQLYYRERTNASLRLGGMVSRTVGIVWTAAVRWHKARRAAAALRECSNETLRDLGIDRSEINSIVFFGDKGRRRGPADYD